MAIRRVRLFRRNVKVQPHRHLGLWKKSQLSNCSASTNSNVSDKL